MTKILDPFRNPSPNRYAAFRKAYDEAVLAHAAYGRDCNLFLNTVAGRIHYDCGAQSHLVTTDDGKTPVTNVRVYNFPIADGGWVEAPLRLVVEAPGGQPNESYPFRLAVKKRGDAYVARVTVGTKSMDASITIDPTPAGQSTELAPLFDFLFEELGKEARKRYATL